MRKYSIAIRGFDAEEYVAENAAKAKAACYRDLREAGFLNRSWTDHGCSPFALFLLLIEHVYAMGEEYGDPRTAAYGVAP